MAFSKTFQRTSIRVCLRDNHGAFVLAKMLQFDQVYQVAVGEALGLYHAIQWMQDMQFDNVDFKLDSKITRDAFHSLKTDVQNLAILLMSVECNFSPLSLTLGSSLLGDQ